MAHPSQGSEPGDDDREQPFGFGFPGLPGFPGGVPGLPGLGDLDLSQLMGMLASPGPVNWEIAKQIARNVATEGKPERPIDPAAPVEFAELARAAQTHVADLTGLASTLAAPVRVIGAVEWADLHLDALKPVLEDLARTLGTALQQEMQAEIDAETGPVDPMAAIMPMLTPVLLGLQAGSMIGYLALHALGRYDLPLPVSDPPSLCFVAPHIDEFEDAWSLPRADLRFTIATHEVVHAAMRSVPWVGARLVRLASEYVRAYHLDLSAIEDRFGMIDPSDPQSFEALTANPREILGAMQSPAQTAVQERLRVFAIVLEGYADAVIARVTERLVPTRGQIHEAFLRHRIDRGEAGHFVDALLGIDLGRDDYERGHRFCEGVIERAGIDGLNRLWSDEAMVPTPAELDAPGLWLARIDLPELDDLA